MKLELGYNTPFEVRTAHCAANVADSFSVLYLSDLHFTGFSQPMVTSLLQKINELNPSLILLGGDYADTRKGLLLFEKLMQGISHRKLFAVAGNHDYFFGIERLKQLVTNNHGCWIEGSSAEFSIQGTPLRIDGNCTSKAEDGRFNILCLHKPLPPIAAVSYNLAFAGHLHGGQVVLWQRGQNLYPARWFYRNNFLVHNGGHSYYFISKGLGDTLPLRYNCKRDMLLVNVHPAATPAPLNIEL